MTRIKSTSSIEKKRIHTNYVQRLNRTQKANTVDRISPVRPVENDITRPSVNHLMYSDTLYDSLMDLKKEYLNFYHHERNLQKAIEEIEKDENIPMDHIHDLIDKYNFAYVALKNFDKTLRTNHHINIKNIVEIYQKDLNKMGIDLYESGLLDLNEDKFKYFLLASKSNMDKSFEPIKELILKLYKEFKNIKGPYRDEYNDGYQYLLDSDMQGNLLDKKSWLNLLIYM